MTKPKKQAKHTAPGKSTYLKSVITILHSKLQNVWRDQEKRLVLIGLAGVILAYMAGALFYAGALPGRGTADSPLHIDYAWQVWHGDLPQFWEGPQIPTKGPKAPVQFVSQHPPLYYVLIAPVIGVFVDAGNYALAVTLARLITITIGLGCLLAFAWGGWVIGGKYRALFAVALPAILTSLVPFIKVAGDTYNDTLVLLLSTLALVLTAVILQRGPCPKYIAAAAVVALLGMSTRASFLAALLVMLAAIGIATLAHTKGTPPKRLFRAGQLVGVVVVVTLLGIGWFYWRNYQASGKWYRSGPQSWAADILGKPKKSFQQVITNEAMWLIVPERLFGKPWTGWRHINNEPFNVIVSLTVFTACSLGAILWVRREYQRLKKISPVMWLIAGFFGLYVAVIMAQQIRHATGYGGINVRYFLPVWLPLGLMLTAGALVWRRARGQIVIGLVVLNWLGVFANTMWYLGRVSSPKTNHWQNLITFITEKNGLPIAALPLLAVMLLAGIGLQAVVLWRLTARTAKV